MAEIPLVSVCIPAYNSATTIERCLQSVLAQDYENVEILVVDDHSSDGTVRISRNFAASVCVTSNERNLGLVGNHNRCIELSNGKYVKFVHADDYLLPGAISTMVNALQLAPSSVLAFSRRSIESTVEYFIRDSSVLHGPLEPLSGSTDGVVLIERFIRDGARRNLFGEPTSIMFDRDLAVKVGGFSHDLPQLLDLGLWLALLEHGEGVWIDKPLSVRVHTRDTATESNHALGVGALDVLRLQLSLTRSPVLSTRDRLIVGRLAVLSFAKAAGKAMIHSETKRKMSDLLLVAHSYIAGNLRSPGHVVWRAPRL